MQRSTRPNSCVVIVGILAELVFAPVAMFTALGRAEDALPPEPRDARRLENDVLGVRVWGPPTLSVGKADI